MNDPNDTPDPPDDQLRVINEIASRVEPAVRVKILEGLRQVWELGYLTGTNDTYKRVQVLMKETYGDV